MVNTFLYSYAHTIVDSVTDGVFTVDGDFRITSFNRAAEHITGVSREEAVGCRCYEVFHANICEEECLLRRTMRTGNPEYNRLIYIVNSNGKRVPISVSTAILRDGERIVGGVETFRDLTQIEELRKELNHSYSFFDIISKNHRMLELFDILSSAAESQSTVLIEGESGTGKELFARAIHNLSPRRNGPFVAVNCGSIPDTLLESELFGYLAGAFTDARKDKPGKFEVASGGTIFLDEIGDVSPALQVRLLRVLQERVFEPLGGVSPIKCDVRVLAATNRPLEKLVKEGKIRDDLYYRINVVKLVLPPLRERRDDIPLLCEHFIERFNELQDKNVLGLEEDAVNLLMQHSYPGNVRELENIIEHAFVLCSSGFIGSRHLPESISGKALLTRKSKDCLNGTFKELEKAAIIYALRKNSWNRLAAAEQLGIHKTTLFRKIKTFDIQLPDKDGRSAKRSSEV